MLRQKSRLDGEWWLDVDSVKMAPVSSILLPRLLPWLVRLMYKYQEIDRRSMLRRLMLPVQRVFQDGQKKWLGRLTEEFSASSRDHYKPLLNSYQRMVPSHSCLAISGLERRVSKHMPSLIFHYSY
jgi:hypothetical protein